ncbi:hypothetical protein [Pseudorhodobacter sp.]|uniref:hypothetical protein n=1 Tax=Pseudorhodobacter sp. TaxID=1934400 RepID=UPI002648EC8D|nr:hypothetical protein [Pseudorhodobacter sp.]MDN5789225.1 hypothetical protein [Pseudorhodobacter sp.]
MIRAIILLTLLAAPAHADPDRLSILLSSRHVAATVPFKQANPGLFLTWENRAAGLDYSLGAYRNSYGRLSVAAIAALPIWKRDQTQISLFAGVAHYPVDGRDYAVHAGDFVPLAGVQFRHRNIFAQVMPGDGNFTSGIISFGLTFKLGH